MTAVLTGAEPEASVRRVLPCYRVLDRLEALDVAAEALARRPARERRVA